MFVAGRATAYSTASGTKAGSGGGPAWRSRKDAAGLQDSGACGRAGPLGGGHEHSCTGKQSLVVSRGACSERSAGLAGLGHKPVRRLAAQYDLQLGDHLDRGMGAGGAANLTINK